MNRGDGGPSSKRLRALADILRVTAAVTAAAFLLTGQVEGAIRFLLVFLVLLVPRRLEISSSIDAVFGVVLLGAAVASAAHVYRLASWSDLVIHFALGGASSALLYVVLVRLRLLPPVDGAALPHSRFSLVILTVALGLTAGVLWELYEWTASSTFATGEIIVGYEDTLLDLSMDALGSVVAGTLLHTHGNP